MSIKYGVKDIIKAMVELEECGMNFYNELAEARLTDEVKEMLRGLAKQEKHHKKIYSDLLEEYTEDVEISEEQREYIKQLIMGSFELKGKAERGVSDISEALLVAKGLEEDSIKFIDSFAGIAGIKNKEFLEQIRKEEEGHLKMVERLIANLT